MTYKLNKKLIDRKKEKNEEEKNTVSIQFEAQGGSKKGVWIEYASSCEAEVIIEMS